MRRQYQVGDGVAMGLYECKRYSDRAFNEPDEIVESVDTGEHEERMGALLIWAGSVEEEKELFRAYEGGGAPCEIVLIRLGAESRIIYDNDVR